MKVLSLFDGMSCGMVALQRVGIPVTQYIASEIDKYALIVSRRNHPSIIQMGDVVAVRVLAEAGMLGWIDLLLGGSPCQGFSAAGAGKAFDDPRSRLFFEYVRILRALQRTNPNIKFLLENVKMKKEWLNTISNFIGVNPVRLNSALVSAQNRERYYWCNWDVPQPADRGIYLRDIIEHGAVDRDKSYCIDANYYKGGSLDNYLDKARRQNDLSPRKLFNTNPSGNGMNGWVYHPDHKASTVTTNKGEGNKIAAFRSDEKRLMVREIAGVSITDNGIRPYKNDGRKGSLSEIGTIGTPDTKSSCITSEHPPKIGRIVGRRINPETGKRDDYNPNIELRQYIEARPDEKCGTLTTVEKDNILLMDYEGITYRKLTVTECERLQTLEDGYTAGVSNTQRYKMLGNGWTVEMIAHILRSMPQ